jgi:hypothetical protein
MKGLKIGRGFKKGLLLSTNGGKRYPFTFFGIEFGIGSFSWHPDRLEKRSNKRILVMLE